jgi:PhnB protein
MLIQPYLFFHGNCEEAMRFYERVLKGKITDLLPHAGTPAEEHVSPEWKTKILHARLEVGDAALLASDSPYEKDSEKRGSSVSLHLHSIEEAERIFEELSAEGNVTMPMAPTFWALRFAMFEDRFGVPWMINCTEPKA